MGGVSPTVLLVGQVAVILVAVLVCWVVATRRLPARWSSIGWGALTFPLSQVARFALLIPLTLLLQPALGARFAPVNTALLILTSGLFEESTRWIVLRFWARRVRDRTEGIAYGLGHGGCEAILLVGSAAISGITVLATADSLREAISAQTPDQLAAFEVQLATLQGLTIGVATMGVYERVVAVVFHVVMSLLVLRAVRSGRWRWWATAVVLHCAFNGVAIGLASAGVDVVIVEAAMTLIVAALVWAVWRGPWSSAREPAPGSPA